MQSRLALVSLLGSSLLIGGVATAWAILYQQGKRVALRDRLQQADAIVSVAGTLGNIKFLDGKTDTAVSLYRQGWAPIILFAGRFSHQSTGTPQLMPASELEAAVAAGRIDRKTATDALTTWDVGLDAEYMRDRAIRAGVPSEAILVERASLHTLENAQFSVSMLAERGAQRVILVTSPFHQLRAYLTFAKVYGERGIQVMNYAAETDVWRPLTWFFSSQNRRLVRGEIRRIKTYRAKGDLL